MVFGVEVVVVVSVTAVVDTAAVVVVMSFWLAPATALSLPPPNVKVK
jgi:hypothetical protein